ncbi:STAS domain-containing protein [Marinobacter adhaerens]|jgi:ABC-type transporter Mla MlaB component|uniref:STAS domain-containing protein n=1 Tax=Marinobacter adhaerens TaxID=1033846 RepID=UPI001E56891C|nr:STAS domain-containing protein [Marinobacter adhaerens]MCD1646502.1 STAS domain-containing protein [Marinobacter adhaerens]
MDVRVDANADLTTWNLESGLTIYEVRDLHENAMNALPKTRRLVINGESIEEIDTAGLQWILAIQRWTKEQDIDLLLELGDGAVMQLLDLFHAHGLLGLPAILVASKRDAKGAPDADE